MLKVCGSLELEVSDVPISCFTYNLEELRAYYLTNFKNSNSTF